MVFGLIFYTSAGTSPQYTSKYLSIASHLFFPLSKHIKSMFKFHFFHQLSPPPLPSVATCLPAASLERLLFMSRAQQLPYKAACILLHWLPDCGPRSFSFYPLSSFFYSLCTCKLIRSLFLSYNSN